MKKNETKEYQAVEQILSSDFYKVDVVELAQKLIGKIIIRQLPQGEGRGIIVETEAYKAPDDKASHAYNNKKTERTKYFWQDGGHLYVYSIYGNNYCLNITAASKDDPEAVLIRAIQPLSFDIIKEIRKTKSSKLQDIQMVLENVVVVYFLINLIMDQIYVIIKVECIYQTTINNMILVFQLESILIMQMNGKINLGDFILKTIVLYLKVDYYQYIQQKHNTIKISILFFNYIGQFVITQGEDNKFG
ncbi:unnamed protein product [Paramecium sonneborni]|uniref:3-methyladenine DNA glycosidase n=1 Tax=Paramecium sonneborni TaxID=65129 RepID=A0A8S1Q7G0_9CILI|nr:unnamed protein product [Paramecium sonneborni]